MSQLDKLASAVNLAVQKGLIGSKEEIDQFKSKVGIDVVTLFNLKGEKVASLSMKELSSAESMKVLDQFEPPTRTIESLFGNDERHPKKLFEYKFVRIDLKGRGITLEINLLDVDGVRVSGWLDEKGFTLPMLLQKLGRQGWDMVNHAVNQDNKANTVTLHYFTFKREI